MPKPVLKDFRETKKISIPGIENAEVEIYDSVLYGETAAIAEMIKDPGNPDSAANGLIKIIKGWNFTDEHGTDIPVTAESLKLLPAHVITHIGDEFKTLVEGKKKDIKVK